MSHVSSSDVVCDKCGSTNIVVTLAPAGVDKGGSFFFYLSIVASIVTIAGAVYGIGRLVVGAGIVITLVTTALPFMRKPKPKSGGERIVCRNCGYHGGGPKK